MLQAQQLVDALYASAPVPVGCRVNHARGVLAEGYFEPAKDILEVPLGVMNTSKQSVTVRFSSSSGNPEISEAEHTANPRGLAIMIGERPHLVLVGHSVEAFPARDPATFLNLLNALNAHQQNPGRLAHHLQAHRAAGDFEAARIGTPISFVSLRYHMLHPYRLITRDGRSLVGRLSIAGTAAESASAAPTGPDYLTEELRRRLALGPIEMALLFQQAPHGIDIGDISCAWKHAGKEVVLGRIQIDRLHGKQGLQRTLVFDPSVLPDGIEFAGDPLIATRLAAYRIAAARRCPFSRAS